MGSLKDWIWVFASGAFWVLAMRFFSPGLVDDDWMSEKDPSEKRLGILWDYFNDVLAGIFFGMSITFQSRLFHRPLLIVFLLILIVALLSTWIWLRVWRRSPPKSEPKATTI